MPGLGRARRRGSDTVSPLKPGGSKAQMSRKGVLEPLWCRSTAVSDLAHETGYPEAAGTT
jgi:hypothetical protein